MNKQRHGVTVFSHGDSRSELNVQRRLNYLREIETDGSGSVPIPKSWLEDPAMKKAVAELDWLHVEE